MYNSSAYSSAVHLGPPAPPSLLVPYSNWRKNPFQARKVADNLSSLILMIENISSVVKNDRAPGSDSFRKLLWQRENSQIVDDMIGMLLRMEEELSKKVSEIEIRPDIPPKWKTTSFPESSPAPNPIPLMETAISAPVPYQTFPKKRVEIEPKKRKVDDIEEPQEDYIKDNYGFLNFPNIELKADQVKKIMEFLKFCRIEVDFKNIIIYNSGPMYSAAYQDRLFISFDVVNDERAEQDLHRLFFHDKCEPVNEMNKQLFEEDTSLHVTLVRSITPYLVYKFDMASRFIRHLSPRFPPSKYTMILSRGCVFIHKRLTNEQQVFSCQDLYRQFPDQFDAEYHNMGYAGRRLLKKMTRRVEKGMGSTALPFN